MALHGFKVFFGQSQCMYSASAAFVWKSCCLSISISACLSLSLSRSRTHSLSLLVKVFSAFG